MLDAVGPVERASGREDDSDKAPESSRPRTWFVDPVWVWGVPFASLSMAETVSAIADLIEAGRPSFFITANVNYAMLTDENPDLRAVNERAAFIVADGAPLVWASRWQGSPLPERVAGSDLIFEVSAQRRKRGIDFIFWEVAEGVAAQAAARLCERFPGLQVVGCESPPFREPDPGRGSGTGRSHPSGSARHPVRVVHPAQGRALVGGDLRLAGGSSVGQRRGGHRLCRRARPSRPALDAEVRPGMGVSALDRTPAPRQALCPQRLVHRSHGRPRCADRQPAGIAHRTSPLALSPTGRQGRDQATSRSPSRGFVEADSRSPPPATKAKSDVCQRRSFTLGTSSKMPGGIPPPQQSVGIAIVSAPSTIGLPSPRW